QGRCSASSRSGLAVGAGEDAVGDAVAGDEAGTLDVEIENFGDEQTQQKGQSVGRDGHWQESSAGRQIGLHAPDTGKLNQVDAVSPSAQVTHRSAGQQL